MERIHTLINKLNNQLQDKQNMQQLLTTAQMLVAELSNFEEHTMYEKVSVLMPQTFSNTTISVFGQEQETVKPFIEPKVELLKKPVIIEVEDKNEVVLEKTKPIDTPIIINQEKSFIVEESNKVLHTLFVDETDEIPTLAPKEISEVNDRIKTEKQSLNEVLKEDKKEIASNLVDTPVKDLRKAIGINDKYVFINELFNGDEATYERSIKTINNFSVYPEAEQWIKRELYTKLCWLDNSKAVEEFYSVVRRRFA